jgi:hypothetical protein
VILGAADTSPTSLARTRSGAVGSIPNALSGPALNYADLDALVAHVGQVEWLVRLAVQLLIQDQEQDFFRVWMFSDGPVPAAGA